MIEPNFRDNTTQATIDGLVYTSTKLGAIAGVDLLPKLSALLGDAVLRLILTGSSEVLRDPGVAAAIFVRVSERAGSGLPIKDLLKRVKCNALRPIGKPGSVVDGFDDHFAGEYVHLLNVCEFAARHNFLGFTLGSLSMIGSPSETGPIDTAG
jgi:hypothetical protein